MTYVAPRIGYDVSFKFLPLLSGDFNACLGACNNGDDSSCFGTLGVREEQCSWTVACEMGVAAWFVHILQAGNQHWDGGRLDFQMCC